MIEFKKHFVKNTKTGAKCRVRYSNGQVFNKSGELVDCVTLYAKDCLDKLSPVFGLRTKNDSDSMSDYFENDRVRIFTNDPLHAAALARC